MFLKTFGEILRIVETQFFGDGGNRHGGSGQEFPCHEHSLILVVHIGSHMVSIPEYIDKMIFGVMISIGQILQFQRLVRVVVDVSADDKRQRIGVGIQMLCKVLFNI